MIQTVGNGGANASLLGFVDCFKVCEQKYNYEDQIEFPRPYSCACCY